MQKTKLVQKTAIPKDTKKSQKSVATDIARISKAKQALYENWKLQ